MKNLKHKYRFWRSIRIGKPLYLDEHGRRIDGPPLKFWQIWIIRIKLWFGIKFTDDIRTNETTSEPFTGAILGARTWDHALSPEEVQADYERHINDDA